MQSHRGISTRESIMRFAFVAAAAIGLGIMGAANGATISLTLNVSSTTLNVGDTFTVDVYAQVTGNNYLTTPLGFSNLYANVISTGGTVGAIAPVPETGLGG